MWHLFVTTGMRRSEVAALRQHRKVQLEEQIALHGSWRDPERVFTSPVGGRLYPPAITRAFHVLTNRAGLQRIRLHDLRPTFATLSLKSDEPAKIVTERLGHSTTAYTRDAYQVVKPGMQRDPARRFGQRLQRPPATSNDGDAPDEQDVP